MTALAPTWLPERRKQAWEIGLSTGFLLGFGASALLTATALFSGDQLASQLASVPGLHLLFGAMLLTMAVILILLFRRSNRGGEQA